MLSEYSQACSNDHLYKTTTRIRRTMLSTPKQTAIQSLLYRATSCLTRPSTTIFVSQMKKNLSKTTTTKFYPGKKWETNIREQCIKNKRLWLYYSSATLQCQVCLGEPSKLIVPRLTSIRHWKFGPPPPHPLLTSTHGTKNCLKIHESNMKTWNHLTRQLFISYEAFNTTV